ncbi:MAG: ATP-binding protein [Burkholderiaceae bacterium]|nr:ATP-binding protein [Burkholderiaceae bacterium]
MSKVVVDPIGDGRAEYDHNMLDQAFYEWSDYKALLSDSTRYVVVGRRGTGKSALVYKLSQQWKAEKKFCLEINPNEEELIGFRAVASLLGTSVGMIRAGVKLLWKYALALELSDALSKYYKTSEAVKQSTTIKRHLKNWNSYPGGVFQKLRKSNYEWLKSIDSPESRIAELSERLNLSDITLELKQILQQSGKQGVILVDRLDEGWHSDSIGIGVVDGLVYGTGELREALTPTLSTLVFLRDNIFRSIQTADNDFSRNVEPKVLRLHWDPQELMYMATSRIRTALKIEKQSEIKTWNSCTANELHGISGFRKCLRHTLYRPRDVIALLNAGFYQAQKQERDTLIEADIDIASKFISKSRLDDLEKEYSSVFPGLNLIISHFNAEKIKISSSEVQSFFLLSLHNELLTPGERQHLTILAKEFNGVSALYSIGFIGIRNDVSKTFAFCHDGRQPNKLITSATELVVHPCYWPALGKGFISEDEAVAAEIFDEYEVTIYSADADQRSQILGRTISELSSIATGTDGASQFEQWCKEALTFCFSTQLTNIELHPNKAASQRRDVVGTNLGTSTVWRRILEDYKSRQIIFEIKNYESLGIDEFRQIHGYLGREYGKIGFIICRAKSNELTAAEIAAFREYYRSEANHMIVKLTANWLAAALSKLRSPQKHDIADMQLGRIMDEYIRIYANEQLTRKSHKNRNRHS